MTGYLVNGTEYHLFTVAVDAARKSGSTVTDCVSGRTVWTPMPAVSKARMSRYEHRKAAYEAQQRGRGC
jgi:hypothetical protein